MQTLNNVHHQFAEYFDEDVLKPYAFLVSKKLSEGHICLLLNEVQYEQEELPLHYKDKLTSTKRLENARFVSTTSEKQPFTLHNNRLYIQRYFQYETDILNRLNKFLQEEKLVFSERVLFLKEYNKYIGDLFTSELKNDEKTDWQFVAAVSAVLNNFTIITGGPGTGKTTTVAKILAILYKMNPSIKVALAAPTGKAATRMLESLSNASFDADKSVSDKFQTLVPSTLHRLLGYKADSPNFKYNSSNPLNFDVVIVDESSMIDVALFAKLLKAIGPDTRLIMLGDKDQLASVEAGSLFGDICNAPEQLNLLSKERSDFINSITTKAESKIKDSTIAENNNHPLFEHIIELQYSRRFSDTKGIGKFSKAVINNDEQEIVHAIKNADEEVEIDTTYSEKIFTNFILGYKSYINEKDIQKALQKLNNLRVLCAVREGEHGLYSINRKIERILQQAKLINAAGEFYNNRPIIITRNYYDLNLFNGDTGIIREENGVMKAFFADTEKGVRSIPPGFVSDAETVFAMTVHKSQGSEFDKVLIILPDSPDISILTRELIYTAVTRAKSKVILQAPEAVIFEAAKRQVKRASGIRERFIQFENDSI